MSVYDSIVSTLVRALLLVLVYACVSMENEREKKKHNILLVHVFVDRLNTRLFCMFEGMKNKDESILAVIGIPSKGVDRVQKFLFLTFLACFYMGPYFFCPPLLLSCVSFGCHFKYHTKRCEKPEKMERREICWNTLFLAFSGK